MTVITMEVQDVKTVPLCLDSFAATEPSSLLRVGKAIIII